MADGYVNLYFYADPWQQKVRGQVRVWLPDGPLPDGRMVVDKTDTPPAGDWTIYDMLLARKIMAYFGRPVHETLVMRGDLTADHIAGLIAANRNRTTRPSHAVLDIDPLDRAAYRVSVMRGLEPNPVALFRGNGALNLAIDYASTCFDSWTDPFCLAPVPK